MKELVQEDQVLDADWQTRLKAYPFYKRVFIGGLVILAILAAVLFQVGFLIFGAILLSGTVAYAVLKTLFIRSRN